ncbi:hypothetical protein [Novipirellula rosea]|uniref:hypothetical protein n=1 Tax=Novipirellula rosea TaxID=1031540 RepID=UPI0031E68462
MPNVNLGIATGNPSERVGLDNSPFWMSEPIAERVNRLQIVVVGSVAYILVFLVLRHEVFDIIGKHVAKHGPFASIDDKANPSHRQINVFFCVFFRFLSVLERKQVLLN